jgi:hypothetical protein
MMFVWFSPAEYTLGITQLHRKLPTHEVAMARSLYREAEETEHGMPPESSGTPLNTHPVAEDEKN